MIPLLKLYVWGGGVELKGKGCGKRTQADAAFFKR